MLKSYLFRRVTIIGVGLMGGSLGLALRKYSMAREVVGYSMRHSSLAKAVEKGAIDLAYDDLGKALANADLVVLATPVESIIKTFTAINPHIRRGTIVTDVGSVKASIVDSADKYLAGGAFFVGSHPLAGSEKSGVEFANAELYNNCTCIMTPTDKTNQVAKEKVKYMWSKAGANVKFMAPDVHDRALAYVSHLPHMTAFALMQTVPQEHLELTTPSLRDTTRVAASSAEMWSDIVLANANNLLPALDELVRNVSNLRKGIINKDHKSLVEHFSKAKEKRDAIHLTR